jgi:SAM-dependent methyltransferase
MKAACASTPPEYFAAMYRRRGDPWRMATSAYERNKYRATIALLSPRRFRRALEVGCSVGVLTRLLAISAERLIAVDVDDLPLRLARKRCRDRGNVTFRKLVVPGEWPSDVFDLVVLSEVLYFLAPADIAAAAERVIASTRRSACVLLVHWLGPVDGPCDGDTAARLFMAACGAAFARRLSRRTPRYRMDLLVRA